MSGLQNIVTPAILAGAVADGIAFNRAGYAECATAWFVNPAAIPHHDDFGETIGIFWGF